MEFVRSNIETRNESLADRRDLNVAIDPDILEVIRTSTAVSTQPGNSVHLLKVGSKRRRTRAEIEEFHSLKEDQIEVLAEKDERIEELERQLNKSKSKLQTGE
jgi:hypothetical protein